MSLRVLIHDVGHGQAVHIFTPKGETIVIDLGCSPTISPLEWLSTKTKTIDSLIVTHPHGDHIDEFLLIKSLGFSVMQFHRPVWLDEYTVYKQNQSSFTEKLDAYFEMSKRYTYPISENMLVGNPDVSGGVSIKTFYSPSCGTSNINNHSGVVVIDYEGSTIIIPGDNEPPSWRELMNVPGFVSAMNRADIFMASHHGRESGYCRDIFKTKPLLCVVSDGRVQDTDATARYTYHATGWEVHSRNGNPSKERNCITTRSNGYVDISAGRGDGGQAFLSVTID